MHHKKSRDIKGIDKYFTLKNEEYFFIIFDIASCLKPLQKYNVIRFHSLYGDIFHHDLFNTFDKEKLTGIKSLHFPNYKIVHFLNTIL